METPSSERSAEGAISPPLVHEEHRPKRSSRTTSKASKAAASAQPAGKEKLFDITLHDSKEIPPNGQFIGVNGKQYVIKPGHRVSVPAAVLEVLDNAVQALPEVDDKMRVTGMRNAPRLTYTLHRGD